MCWSTGITVVFDCCLASILRGALFEFVVIIVKNADATYSKAMVMFEVNSQQLGQTLPMIHYCNLDVSSPRLT